MVRVLHALYVTLCEWPVNDVLHMTRKTNVVSYDFIEVRKKSPSTRITVYNLQRRSLCVYAEEIARHEPQIARKQLGLLCVYARREYVRDG